MRRIFFGAAIAFALAAPAAGAAAPPVDELQELRDEIAQLKKSYEQRIAALEARVARAEAVAVDVADSAPKSAPKSAPSGEAAFNPAVSLVLAGAYSRFSQDPKGYALNGFIPGDGDAGPPRRAFGLGESELGIAANIDHILRGQFTLALPANGGAQVEEAFIQTLGLDGGVSLRAGRFYRSIGYLNGQHSHVWDFADRPLAYTAFLGGQWKNDGIQAKWVAPTDLLLEVGGELGAGGEFPSTDRNRNGSVVGALFAHAGGDAGEGGSWRAGLSLLGASPRDRRYDDVDSLGNDVVNSFSGKSRTWIADAVWKQDFPYGRKLTVQGEYFRRRENGALTFERSGAALSGGYAATQSGFYAQAVYQFLPRWRAGYRHDWLDSGRPRIGEPLNAADLPLLAPYRPKRDTLMVDYSASEFSRLRLQLARDESRRAAPDKQIWLQYIVSLGAHGAHRY